jgi:hypothetical protein
MEGSHREYAWMFHAEAARRVLEINGVMELEMILLEYDSLGVMQPTLAFPLSPESTLPAAIHQPLRGQATTEPHAHTGGIVYGGSTSGDDPQTRGDPRMDMGCRNYELTAKAACGPERHRGLRDCCTSLRDQTTLLEIHHAVEASGK